MNMNTDIQIGDLVRVSIGPLAGSVALVMSTKLTLNTFSPISGWIGGPSLKIETDLGTVHHYQLDPSKPVEFRGWCTQEEIAKD